MVDSSVGGKTGVNFNNVKNLIGTFYQPQQVIIDINFLKTLNEVEFTNGLAEVIKIAFMFDKGLIEKLMLNNNYILARNNNCLFDIIKSSIEQKIHVVEIDEKEKPERKLLNFGHTIGHAIEIDTDFTIKHGFAIAMGMFYECLYGVRHGLVSQSVLDCLVNILKLYKLFNNYKIRNVENFLFALKKDKKIENGGIVLSLPVGSGESKIFNNVKVDELVGLFNDNR
jgi:3-dehydroquinate synthase